MKIAIGGAAWTPERIERLKALNTDGLSATQIACELGGTTRNAVLGKLHRLGLCKNTGAELNKILSKAQRARQQKARIERRAAPKQRVSLIPPLPSAPLPDPNEFDRARLAAGSLTLLDLEPHHCRWPVGSSDLTNHRFCGCDQVDGVPYCEHHAQRAFLPAQPRRETGYVPLRGEVGRRVSADLQTHDSAKEFLEPVS